MHERTQEWVDELPQHAPDDVAGDAEGGDDDEYLPCPSELVCVLFDDSGLDAALDQGGVFWPELDHHLRVMSALVDRIDVERTPQEVLDDPLWALLVDLSGSGAPSSVRSPIPGARIVSIASTCCAFAALHRSPGI